MLKDEKLEYQRQLEEYMEQTNVYNIFETMMRELMIETPEDPIPFLINKLQPAESDKDDDMKVQKGELPQQS